MCGIVGYCGYRDCSDVLVDTLSKLEYRGYDSAGIAVFENGEIKVKKSKGKLKDLKAKMEQCGKPVGKAGIGHTRWATHGKPSDINSHPHSGEKVAIVHNGIIENYKQLKEFLISHGETFVSDTDTEVVAKLLGYFYKKNPENPLATIQSTVNELEGSFELGIVFEDFPDVVYATRRQSPLIVGVGKDEYFIASDVTAIISYTKNYYLIDHDEIVEMKQDGVVIYDEYGEEKTKELMTADWDAESAKKGGFPHFMIKEIHEQPNAINMTIKPRIFDGMPNLEECGITRENIKDFKNIYIVACGTAMHAGMVGKYVIEKLARVPVVVDIASEYRYRNPIVGEGDLVIIISQSGETADSLEALKLSKKMGAKTLAIVNVKGSSIAREADMLIYTHAGPEIAVASTKAYIVQLAVMYLFAFQLALAKETINENQCRFLTQELESTPKVIEKILAEKLDMTQFIATKLISADSLLYIGRGLDYALSMEGSLKLKEISYIHSESYAAGELKHGTISLITENTPVIAVATQKNLLEKTVSNIKEVKARGAKVILVTREDFSVDKEAYDYLITLPKMHDILMPIPTAVPLQLIAYYTSVERGNDVDQPRNLAKSVTVE